MCPFRAAPAPPPGCSSLSSSPGAPSPGAAGREWRCGRRTNSGWTDETCAARRGRQPARPRCPPAPTAPLPWLIPQRSLAAGPAPAGAANAPAPHCCCDSTRLVDRRQLLEGSGDVQYLRVLPLQPPRHLLIRQLARTAARRHPVQRVGAGHLGNRRHAFLPHPLVQPLVDWWGGVHGRGGRRVD